MWTDEIRNEFCVGNIRSIKNITYSENTQQYYSKITAQNGVYATHVEMRGMVELLWFGTHKASWLERCPRFKGLLK